MVCCLQLPLCLKKETNLCLNGGDGDQLENPLTLGVSVVHLHSILSHLLSLS